MNQFRNKKRRSLSLIASIFFCVVLVIACYSERDQETMAVDLDRKPVQPQEQAATPQDSTDSEPVEVAADMTAVTDDTLDRNLTEILAVKDGSFIGYHPVNESFLLWFRKQYGDEKLQQVADEAAGNMNPEIWYDLTGRSIHVLWLDYQEAIGLRMDDENRITYSRAASDEEIILSFTGDISFDDTVGTVQYLKQNGLDATITPQVQQILRESDVTMVNNECVYSTGGTPIEGKAYTFRADPQNIHYLTDLGVDIAGIANNHVCDFGLDALVDTIETFENADMPYVGAGRNLEEAKRPWYFVINGRKIAIVAATQIERTYNYTKEATESTPGVLKTLDPTKFVDVIAQAKRQSDIVIVFVHWGTEGNAHFGGDQVALANAFEAAGADAIIGGHTHCLQGISYINDTPVIYSLGNFWLGTTPNDGIEKRDTAVAQLIIDRQGAIRMRFLPCIQENQMTYLETDQQEKQRIITYEQYISQGIQIDADGYVSKN